MREEKEDRGKKKKRKKKKEGLHSLFLLLGRSFDVGPSDQEKRGK